MNITTNRPSIIDVDRFSYSAMARSLTAEDSDLSDMQVGRLFNDAADAGILVRGRRETIRFVWTGVDLTDEGEIISWTFRPVDHRGRPLTDLKVAFITIFND